jgi:hypothetical protein
MAILVGWAVGAVCSVLLATLVVAAFVGILIGGDEGMDGIGIELGSTTEESTQPG